MAASPHATPQDLFARLDELGVSHRTTQHPAFHTVDDGRDFKAAMPGGHTKNLFLTNTDGDLILVSALADAQLRLNQLHKPLGVRRLSFASPDLMLDALGVTPGSVTAFALINDASQRVRFIVDAPLMACDPLNFHPLVNTATTAIARADLGRFVAATGHTLEIIDISGLG